MTRRGVGVAEVHDGRITAYRDDFDRAPMLSQIGTIDLIQAAIGVTVARVNQGNE